MHCPYFLPLSLLTAPPLDVYTHTHTLSPYFDQLRLSVRVSPVSANMAAQTQGGWRRGRDGVWRSHLDSYDKLYFANHNDEKALSWNCSSGLIGQEGCVECQREKWVVEMEQDWWREMLKFQFIISSTATNNYLLSSWIFFLQKSRTCV